jgi:hypothetical protein
VRVEALAGAGVIGVAVVAVGTELTRVPSAVTSGQPVPLAVSCRFRYCRFEYDGVTQIESDSSGFDLKLEVPAAGTALAIDLSLAPAQSTGVHATIQILSPTAADGSILVLNASLGGPWVATPQGHQNIAEFDPAWWAQFGDNFALHPLGGSFPVSTQRTVIVASAAPLVLRISLGCDVKYFADVDAPSCSTSNADVYADGLQQCTDRADDSCAAKLMLAIAPALQS